MRPECSALPSQHKHLKALCFKWPRHCAAWYGRKGRGRYSLCEEETRLGLGFKLGLEVGICTRAIMKRSIWRRNLFLCLSVCLSVLCAISIFARRPADQAEAERARFSMHPPTPFPGNSLTTFISLIHRHFVACVSLI